MKPIPPVVYRVSEGPLASLAGYGSSAGRSVGFAHLPPRLLPSASPVRRPSYSGDSRKPIKLRTMQNMPRRRRDIIPLIRRIRCREVRILIQRVHDTTGRLRPLWRRRNRRHTRLTTLAGEEGGWLLLRLIVILPAPFGAEVFVDEVDAPARLFLDLVEDVQRFFLLAANGKELAGDGEAAD